MPPPPDPEFDPQKFRDSMKRLEWEEDASDPAVFHHRKSRRTVRCLSGYMTPTDADAVATTASYQREQGPLPNYRYWVRKHLKNPTPIIAPIVDDRGESPVDASSVYWVEMTTAVGEF